MRVAAFAAMSCLAWGLPASAQASSPPSVESESVSNITPTDGTIQATINPEGLETTYEVSVATVACIMMRPQGPGPDSCERTSHGQIVGTVPAGFSTQTVSVDIAKAWHRLSPSTWYVFYVSVANTDGDSGGTPNTSNQFETAAASPPSIDSESISHLTSTNATLEAQINSEGLETSYQFRLESGCLWPRMCLAITVYPLPSGKLLGSFVDQSVSLDLNSAGVTLGPGVGYAYSVTATNAAGSVTGHEQRFTTPQDGVQAVTTTPSPGPQPGTGPAQNRGQDTATSETIGSVNEVTPLSKTRVLTNAQKLAKALQLCAKKPKKQRASCSKQAHKKYGTTALKAKKR